MRTLHIRAIADLPNLPPARQAERLPLLLPHLDRASADRTAGSLRRLADPGRDALLHFDAVPEPATRERRPAAARSPHPRRQKPHARSRCI